MKPIFRRVSFCTVAALALVSTLTGCGGGTQPGGNNGATAWALTGGSEAAFRTSFDSWNTAHPDEHITVDWFANDAYKEKIRTAIGSGNSPSLVYSWAGGTLADYVKNDNIIDITEDAKGITSRLMPSVAANGQIDGKTYAVPNNQSQPAILYHNKEVFEDAGATVPTTFEELITAVGKLKAAGVIPIALAGQSKWPELMWIQYLTDRIGGPEVFQAVLDGKPDAWSDPAILEATEKIKELVDAGAFGDTFGSVNADANADTALVHTGKAAMVLQGNWVYSNFLNDAPELVSSGNLGYSNFPTVAGGKGDPANIVGNPANFWSVSASASKEAQETGKKYISTAVLNDDMIDELLELGGIPPVMGLEDKIAQTENPEYLEFTYSMVRDAPHYQLSWDQALPSGQAQELLDNLSQLFLGQKTPQEFSDAMNAGHGK